ncbi:MAG: hypothetical protein FVQ82_07925 [Planctomycetes bacterium]|nr:hypothetical protein [Planctomycetota bacterium]
MDCTTIHESNFSVELGVNGQKIDLNRFVESFISQAVIGMLKSLRGVGEVENIDLKISKEAKGPKAQ